MRSRVPVPPQVPLVKFFSPEKSDNGLIEFWSSEVASYQALDLGAVHPNTRDFAGYKLVKQSNLPNDQRFVVRIWARDDTNPQWFNYALKFVSESAAHPIFIRTFRELRNTYTPRTKGQPLKAVYKLSLTNVGTGYTPGTLPALTFSNGGTGGTGAAGHAVVAPDQTIAELVLDESGSGYNTAPTFTIEAPPSGTTATGTAVIQPATAVLVAEEAQEFPDDSEFNGLYLSVVRVYQTLPGPDLTTQQIGQENLIPPKYRGLTTHLITETDVSAALAFPVSLTGNQVFIEQAMQTIAIARKKIVEEVINVGSSLTGHETDEFGIDSIVETIVNDGTAPDEGFGIKTSTVTPFGNGKSLKITVNLPANRVVGLINVTDQGSGYTSAPTVAITGGGGSGATATATIFGDKVIAVNITNGGTGFTSTPSVGFTGGGGTGAAATAILGLAALRGQSYDEHLDVAFPFVETEIAAGAGIGTAHTDIKPIDYQRSRAHSVDTTNISILDNYVIAFPGTANLDLPDELTALTGLMETNSHAGEYINDLAYGEAVDHGTWSVNVRGEGAGGGQIMPDLRIDIRQVYARNVATTHYIFFLPSPVTASAFLTRLATLVGASISAWPKFKPQLHTFTLVGRSLDLTANVDGSASEGFDGEPLMYNSGHGSSRKSGMNIRTIKLPPTIHGSVSVATNSQTLSLATVEAHSVVGSAFPGLDEDVVLNSETIAALITPNSLSATAGASTIPTSGKYLLGSQSDIYKYGYVRCHAEVLDFADV